ncbi:MAG TPA: hypothetical protein VM598_12660, partial [Bdellovibrionota bacterium]|nr:hypothetical protein [Bdellovibrionota bacterium]
TKLGKGLGSALALALLVTGGLLAEARAAGSHYVGEHVYNTTRDAYATIVAIDFNQTYIIRFETGPMAGQTGTGWRDPDLATLSGCSGDLCVGEPIWNTVRDSFAQVAGIQYDGRFVIYFTTGPLAGQTGKNWTRYDLAVLRGCSIDLCVGQRAYNIPRQAQVSIVGIQYDGRYVLRFESGPLAGQYGDGWVRNDLAGGTPPPPPPPPYWTCTVTTQIRQYLGRGGSQGQATAAARDQCLMYESSFSCNAGSVVCR